MQMYLFGHCVCTMSKQKANIEGSQRRCKQQEAMGCGKRRGREKKTKKEEKGNNGRGKGTSSSTQRVPQGIQLAFGDSVATLMGQTKLQKIKVGHEPVLRACSRVRQRSKSGSNEDINTQARWQDERIHRARREGFPHNERIHRHTHTTATRRR